MYDDLCSWSNLYRAYQKACLHKKSKAETAEWMYHCERYLFELQTELSEKRYQPQPYKYFTIHEPKERLISVAAFRDRVVHHALVNIIEPIFESVFIKDSYATRKGKGLHLAVSTAQNYAKRHQWYLKLDIQKYFATIDHDILLKLIGRKIKDPDIIWLCKVILQNQTDSMGVISNQGLPVGNLTSQFFANIYLNHFDYFVKHTLRYDAYIRYMDDFILFSDNPNELKKDLKGIEQFLTQNLALNIKAKSKQINRVSLGIPFLGYRVFPNLLRIRKENLQRCLKGISKTEKEYAKGKVSDEKLYQSTRSRLGYLGFANSARLYKSIWGGNQQAGQTV
ncbi:MAG: reverse transcriptase domain-containing protein [Candidatus Cloacimonadaceae bacterium]